MMRKLFLTIMVLATITVVALVGCKKDASTSAKTKLMVATDSTWPPMEFIDENKQIVGFDIDLMKAVAAAGGFEVEFKSQAWDGIFAGLASGEYDAVISSVTITDERKQQMDFSDPYINAGQVIVVRADSKDVTVLKDLVGKNVAAQIGTTGANEIDKVKGVIKKTYDELGLAIEDLVNKKVDAVVCDTPIAANYALQKKEYKDKLKIVGTPFTDEFYGVAVKKGNKAVVDMINGGLKKVLGTEEYQALEKKWLK